MQCGVVQCGVVQCSAVQCSAVQYSAVTYGILLKITIILRRVCVSTKYVPVWLQDTGA
jgi:hypothetical protein